MATKTIVELQVQSNLAELAGYSKQIKDNLKAAGATRLALPVMAAQQGVMASQTRTASQPRLAATQPSGAASDTNLSRGLGGVTGAEGRDFAKQAQGLGGLVHVYATFAANLFAVSAAFTALKNAADTTNMVKGLDQLGAASGRSLGTLSKQMVALTGGALSLRDAMTSVAQASSAGLGNKQIQDLAGVAAKASQALGISMPDAIGRLSRGISKIEPELLDEIGIFVKVDQATQNYALSVGKSAASLSDFEKRQAFANAVLEQGKEKFAAIDAAANPFDKLLASVSNLATTGLQLVNTVLGPIAKFLAESPTGLAIAMAAIIGLLLKQAIPAIGRMKESAAAAAAEAGKLAQAKVDIVRKGYEESALGIKAAANREAKIALDIAIKNADDIANARSEVLGKYEEKRIAKYASQKGAAGKILRKDLQDITPTDLQSLENTARAMDTKALKAQAAGNEQLAKSYIASADAHRGYITVIEDAQKGHAAFIKTEKEAIATSVAAQHQHTLAAKAYVDEEVKKQKALSTATQNQVIANRAVISAKSSDIVATATQTASTKGFIEAMKEANAAVKAAQGDMGPIQGPSMGAPAAAWTLLKAGVSSATSSLATFLDFASPWVEALGLAVTAFGVLDSAMSSATKEQEAFNSKIESTDNAVKTVNDTLELYTKKKSKAFSIEGTQAFTTALTQVSVSFKDQLDAMEEYLNAAGLWDTLKDNFAGIFNLSNTDKLKKSAQKSIGAILKSLEFSSGKEQAVIDISNVLKIDPSSIDNAELVRSAVSKLSEIDLSNLANSFKLITESEQYSTNAAQAFIESLTTIDRLVDQLIQSNAFTDIQGKLGVELVAAAGKFAQALQDPLKALAAIEALAKDPKALAVLDTVDIKELFKATIAIRDLNDAQSDLVKNEATLEKAKKVAVAESNIIGAVGGDYAETLPNVAEVAAQASFDATTRKLEDLKKKAAEFAQAQANLITKMTDEGFNRVLLGLKNAEAQAQISISRAKASVASSAGGDTSSLEYKLRVEEIKIQIDIIDASYKAQLATMANTEELSKLTAQQQLLYADTIKSKAGTDKEIEANNKLADSMTASANKVLTSLNAKADIKSGTSKEKLAETYDAPTLQTARSLIKGESIVDIQRRAAISKEIANIVIAGVEFQTRSEAYLLKLALDKYSVTKDSVNIEMELLNIAGQLNSYSSDSLIDSKAHSQQLLLDLDTTSRQKQITFDLAKLESSQASMSQQSYKDQTALLEVKQTNLDNDAKAKRLALEYNVIKDKGTAAQAKLSASSAIELQNLQSNNSVEEARVGLKQKELDILIQLNQIDELSASRAKTKNEQALLSLKYASDEAKLKADIASKELILKNAKEVETKAKSAPPTIASALALGQATAGVGVAQSQVDAAKLAKDNAGKANDIVKQGIDLQQTYNEKLIAQKQHLADIASIAETLGTVFGKTGTSIGSVVTAFDSLNRNQKDREDSLKNANLNEKERTALVRRNARAEATDQAKLISSVKSLFKEKTFVYKAMGAIEKAAQLRSISLLVAENSAKLGLYLADMSAKVSFAIEGELGATAAANAGFLTRLPTYIAEIYASWGKLGPWMVGAASVFIASKLGASGGGTVNMAGMTAEDRQSVQGTGTAYVEGRKVETGGGVFGDAEAKSESIKNSLEIIKNTSVEGLSFSNEMVDLLTSIDKGISGVAKGVYGVVGIRTGSQFGTQEGSSGKNFLGGLWGSSTSTQITDAGILLKGTFTEFMGNIDGIIKSYEDVLTTSTRSRLWSTKTTQTLTRNIADLEPTLEKAISDVFENAGKLFVVAGQKLGMTAETVMSSLGDISVDKLISLRGLKGADLEKELAAVLGSILDDTSTSLFAAMKDFQEFGEGMLQTVMRVTDGFDKVNLAMISIGKASIESGIAGMQISESLIAAAGGLSEFLDKTKTFADNFLTETERLIPVQAAVNKELNLLGYESNLTKDQIKNVILSFQTIGDTSSNTYIKLLDLSDSINTLETASAAAIDKLDDFDISIYTELGKAEKALQLTREKELKALDESLRPIQEYLNALKDESSVKAKIATAYKDQSAALKNTITGLKASIKTLNDYKTSLTMSASSILTPAEKYAQAKSTMLATASLARQVITASSTAEDIAARDAAVSQLSSTSDAFLMSSREMFASSDRYTQDFKSVLELLDASSIILNAQMSDAEKQQTALDASVSFLDLISTNTDTTATLLAQLLTLQTATETVRQGAIEAGSSAAAASIPAMASGGMARGLTLVGENGPELANFASTARVYSNQATNDIFNTKELVAEIRSLRAEVSQLRADQKQQTGHLIAANYDANAKNAEAVAESTDAVLVDQTWRQRSQVKIA